ncbi:prepilin peptidase [Pseudomonas lini]
MSMELLVSTVVLLGLLGVAVVSDLLRHRIPNMLVLLGLALGLVSQTYSGGVSGLSDSLLGMLICFAFFSAHVRLWWHGRRRRQVNGHGRQFFYRFITRCGLQCSA